MSLVSLTPQTPHSNKELLEKALYQPHIQSRKLNPAITHNLITIPAIDLPKVLDRHS